MPDEIDNLDPEALAQALRSRSTSNRTMAARLKPLMPWIEQLIREGVHHEDIVKEVNNGGLAISFETFRKYLYRYRKKNKETGGGTSNIKTGGNQSVIEDQVQAAAEPEPKNEPLDIAETEQVDDNAQVTEEEPESLDDILSARNREEFGNQYLAPSRRRRNRK